MNQVFEDICPGHVPDIPSPKRGEGLCPQSVRKGIMENLQGRYLLEFLPEIGFTNGWSPDAPDGLFEVLCPVCRHDYTHPVDPIMVDGEDAGKAWSGRGDAVKVPFVGECGHRFALCFGFHKGQTFCFWEYSG